MNGVDGVDLITFDKRRGIHGLRKIKARLRDKRFSLLLHMHASMRANLVSRIIPAGTRIGFDRQRARDYQWMFTNQRIPWRPEQHVMEGLFGFVELLGLQNPALRWDIPIPDSDRRFASDTVGESKLVLAISPCTSQRFRNYRNWPAKHFATIAQYAHQAYGAEIILTGARTRFEQEYGATITAAAGVPVLSEIELAFRFCRTPVIGVTGTNGKTTTAGLIQTLLEAAGFRAPAAGNIGAPSSPPWPRTTLRTSSWSR